VSRRRRRKGWGNLPLEHPIELPGDKSLSHRAVILAALGRGTSEIAGLNAGADVRATVECLGRLGVRVELDPDDPTKAQVHGEGSSGLREPSTVLDAGNSGTTLRALLGVCARVQGTSFLAGDETLGRRPMLRVVEPLRRMGATIHGRDGGNFPPLAVVGGALRGIAHSSEVASAQVKTCLLLAGLGAEGTTSITEPALSRDHTERMLSALGVVLTRSNATVTLEGPQELAARDWRIPSDPSAAMFFIVAALLVPGSDLLLSNVSLNPTRTGAFKVLRAMGGDIEIEEKGEDGGEPFGDVRARASELQGVAVDPAVVPALIDEIPILAIAATQAEGETSFTGAEELRVKESDRIDTLATALRTLDVQVEALPDGLRIEGPATLGEGDVDARDDHRIAMSLAVAALIARTDIRIRGWSSVDTSFPGFIETLGRARGMRR
jgi:3-phosphoshikimate 1-carboxyvinyltransferase